MGIFEFLFGREAAPQLPDVFPSDLFSNVPQETLNDLASMMPHSLEASWSPSHEDTDTRMVTNVVLEIGGEGDDISVSRRPNLMELLSVEQFNALVKIQQLFVSAQDERNPRTKRTLYHKIINIAPWHCFAMKSLGVCYYEAGSKKKSYMYLKKAAELAPNDSNILANLQHVEDDWL